MHASFESEPRPAEGSVPWMRRWRGAGVALYAWLSPLAVSLGCSTTDYHPLDSEKSQAAGAGSCSEPNTAYDEYVFCAACGAEQGSLRYEIRQWGCSSGHALLAAQSAAPRCALVPGACPNDGDASEDAGEGTALDASYEIIPAPNPVSNDAGSSLDGATDTGTG